MSLRYHDSSKKRTIRTRSAQQMAKTTQNTFRHSPVPAMTVGRVVSELKLGRVEEGGFQCYVARSSQAFYHHSASYVGPLTEVAEKGSAVR